MENHDTDTQEVEDIISLLATQSESEDNYEGDDDTYSDELPDDIDELKKMYLEERERVGKRNKTLKKRTDATHRMQDEIKSLQDAISDMKSAPPAPDTGAQDQEYKETLEKWRDSVADKPETAIDFANAQTADLRNSMVQALAEQESRFEGLLRELKGEVDPEKQKYQAKMEMLRKNPAFAELEEGALLKVAKGLDGFKPRGSLLGRKPDQKPTSDKLLDEAREQAAKYFANGLNG